MIVTNDRSAGGSAFRNGTIEIMINRRGTGNDDLGNEENMNEVEFMYDDFVGIRVNPRFKVQFTKDRR